mmetsp:Transcript_57745/g.114560  ORF Transcript_57745/g.114560 Transcript_57745/m.114560 type:complete len:781 (-) Transcript_57745:155-2497(-)
MGKKKGAAAKARSRQQRTRSPGSPKQTSSSPMVAINGAIVHKDGQRVHKGLANLGNTCFMNSIMQCLNVSLPFSDELLGMLAEGLDGLGGSLCKVFRGIREIDDDKSSKVVYNPKPFREELISKFPWYRTKEQQDAHELLRTVLGSIADELEEAEKAAKVKDEENVPPASEVTQRCGHCVSRNFRGHLCAATLCWECSKVSLRLDPFLDLSLDLPSLAGRAIGAMGVTAATASGAPPPPEQEDPAEGDAESEKEKRYAKKEGNKRVSKAEAAAKKKASKPQVPSVVKAPHGVWAGRQDVPTSQEFRERVRTLVGRIIIRALEKADSSPAEECPPHAETQAEAEPEVPTVEIELSRPSKKSAPAWGFRWSETKLEEEVFVISAISEDTPLEKWNLKCRALGDNERVICVGDELVEVNGETNMKEMRKSLKSVDRVQLCFKRGSARTAGEAARGGCRGESDDEAERRAEEAAKREQLRKDFCDRATQCHEALPEFLREIFGPEKAHEKNGHLRLDDCLRRFSVVEALEDEYQPIYQCASCSTRPADPAATTSNSSSRSTGKRRTYASRRLWLWQPDMPPLLTLQLKRFRRYFSKFEKSTTSIALPTVLDVSDYVLTEPQLDGIRTFLVEGQDLSSFAIPSQPETTNGVAPALPMRYELYGICVHQGNSMQSGHYVAYVNGGPSLEKEAWFGISDARLWKCGREEVLKAEAYIAFYRHEGLVSSTPHVAADASPEEPDEKNGVAKADEAEAEGSRANVDGEADEAEGSRANVDGEADEATLPP